VQERGAARLWEVARFDFVLPRTRSLQMNAGVANDVDPKYELNPRIVILEVHVGDV